MSALRRDEPPIVRKGALGEDWKRLRAMNRSDAPKASAPESNVALLKAPAARAAEPYRTPVAPSAPLQAQTRMRTPKSGPVGRVAVRQTGGGPRCGPSFSEHEIEKLSNHGGVNRHWRRPV